MPTSHSTLSILPAGSESERGGLRFRMYSLQPDSLPGYALAPRPLRRQSVRLYPHAKAGVCGRERRACMSLAYIDSILLNLRVNNILLPRQAFMIFPGVAQVITALLRAGRLIVLVLAGAILYWLFDQFFPPARTLSWYLGFCAAIALPVWGFQWLLAEWERERGRRIAWLTIRTLVLSRREVEAFKDAWEARNLEEVERASLAVQAAIRDHE